MTSELSDNEIPRYTQEQHDRWSTADGYIHWINARFSSYEMEPHMTPELEEIKRRWRNRLGGRYSPDDDDELTQVIEEGAELWRKLNTLQGRH